MKTLPTKITNDYAQTATYQGQNDVLDENQLVAEEKEIERITAELNRFEKGVTQLILTEIDKQLFKIANVIAKPQSKSKGKKIKVKPPTATPTAQSRRF